jgi:hypothetical protein
MSYHRGFDRYDVWTKSFYAAITGVAQDSILNKKQVIMVAAEMADLALQEIEQRTRDGRFAPDPQVPYHKAVTLDKTHIGLQIGSDECDD